MSVFEKKYKNCQIFIGNFVFTADVTMPPGPFDTIKSIEPKTEQSNIESVEVGIKVSPIICNN